MLYDEFNRRLKTIEKHDNKNHEVFARELFIDLIADCLAEEGYINKQDFKDFFYQVFMINVII